MGILHPNLCTDGSCLLAGQGLPETTKTKIQGPVAKAIGKKFKTQHQQALNQC